MKMHQNSLFAVLLRSPWWVSALIAIGIVAIGIVVSLRFAVSELFGVFAALPFIVISAYVAYRQLRAPGAGRIAGTLERVRAMSWDDFSRAIEEAYRREGYTVSRLGDARADFELAKAGRSTLVACKRWKATRTGVEPLRELEAMRRAREAHECIYVAAGEITEQARAFAAEQNIRLLHGAELAKLLPKIGDSP